MTEATASTTAAPLPTRSGLRDAFRSPAFWLLIAALLATKLIALFTFGHWADADECVVGIMAKHILERGVHPLYYYGQNYAGGGSIEAHTAALFYRLFGMSGYSLKLAALVYTLAGAVVLYGLTVRLADKRTALFALLIYILMPGLIKWGLKTRGGYVVMLPLVPGMFWMVDRIVHRDRVDHAAILALLAMVAVGMWNMQSILPLVVLIALFIGGYWFRRRRFDLLLGYAAYGVAAGAVAVWWYVQGSSGMMDTLFQADRSDVVKQVLTRLGVIVSAGFSDFFQPFLNDMVEGFSWPAPVTYVLFICAFGFVAWRIYSERPRLNPTLIPVLLYIPVHLFSFAAASPRVMICPRYLFPIIPAIAVIGAVALARMPRPIRSVLVGYVVLAFAFFNIGLMRNPRLYEHGVFYNPADIRGLAKVLEDLDVRFVRTTYVMEWRLLFETQERVIAVNLREPIRYAPYRRQLQDAARQPGVRIAFVFRRDGVWEKHFLSMSPTEFAGKRLDDRRIPFRTVEAGPYVIYVTQRGQSTSPSESAKIRRGFHESAPVAGLFLGEGDHLADHGDFVAIVTAGAAKAVVPDFVGQGLAIGDFESELLEEARCARQRKDPF